LWYNLIQYISTRTVRLKIWDLFASSLTVSPEDVHSSFILNLTDFIVLEDVVFYRVSLYSVLVLCVALCVKEDDDDDDDDDDKSANEEGEGSKL